MTAMCRYTVLADSEAAREMALLDACGKLHVASWRVARPILGEVTCGLRAALRFHALNAEFRVVPMTAIPRSSASNTRRFWCGGRCSRRQPCWPYAAAGGCLRQPAGRRLATRCNAPFSPNGNRPKSRQQRCRQGPNDPA